VDGCVLEDGWKWRLQGWNGVYHGARRPTGKISKVITECRSEIAKERNERARSARVEKQIEEREVLIKVVTVMWSEEKKSLTEGHKLAHVECWRKKNALESGLYSEKEGR
jgi:hypothetical protein